MVADRHTGVMAKVGKWLLVIIGLAMGFVVVLVVVAFGYLLYVRIPQNAAGMAA